MTRLLAIAPSLFLSGLLLGACSAPTPGSGAPGPDVSPLPTAAVGTTESAAPPSTTAAPGAEATSAAAPQAMDYCELTVDAPAGAGVTVRSDGSCGTTELNDGALYYSGVDKPAVQIQFDPGRAVVLSGGGRTTRVSPGASAQFGEYAVHVPRVERSSFVIDLR